MICLHWALSKQQRLANGEPMPLPHVKGKWLGFTLRRQSIREVSSTGWNSWAREGCVASATNSYTINSALKKMQQAIKVASATWRYWLGKSAWAHVRVPAEMLACSFAGLDRDQFLLLHLFKTVWMVASITLTGCQAQHPQFSSKHCRM